MHLSLFHSRCYLSVFYRQLIKNSLGNLPSNLFSNLGNLTELYVEIYMYRSLFIVSLTQFISRCIYMYHSLFVFSLTQFIYIYTYIYIYIYTLILIFVLSSEQRENDETTVWLRGGGGVLKTESKCSLCFFFTLTRALNKRNPKQEKMTKSSGRDLQHVMTEMVLNNAALLYYIKNCI